MNPDGAAAHLGMSHALSEQGYVEEALESCERAIYLDATLAAAYHQKGRLLKVLGRGKEAQEAFKQARQLGFYG